MEKTCYPFQLGVCCPALDLGQGCRFPGSRNRLQMTSAHVGSQAYLCKCQHISAELQNVLPCKGIKPPAWTKWKTTLKCWNCIWCAPMQLGVFCFQDASLEYGQNSLGHVLALQIVEVAPGNGQEPTVIIYCWMTCWQIKHCRKMYTTMMHEDHEPLLNQLGRPLLCPR